MQSSYCWDWAKRMQEQSKWDCLQKVGTEVCHTEKERGERKEERKIAEKFMANTLNSCQVCLEEGLCNLHIYLSSSNISKFSTVLVAEGKSLLLGMRIWIWERERITRLSWNYPCIITLSLSNSNTYVYHISQHHKYFILHVYFILNMPKYRTELISLYENCNNYICTTLPV